MDNEMQIYAKSLEQSNQKLPTDSEESALKAIKLENEHLSSQDTQIVRNYIRIYKDYYYSYYQSFCRDSSSESGNTCEFLNILQKLSKEHMHKILEFKHQLNPHSSRILFEYSEHLVHTQLLNKWQVSPKFRVYLMESGQNVLIITGNSILVSKCLLEIDKYFEKFGRFDQVHFVGSETIFIDESLRNSKWHGTNVLLIAKQIICALLKPNGELEWDLSGKDGLSDWISWRKGRCHGEPGGHVTMVANIFQNLSALFLRSDGGLNGYLSDIFYGDVPKIFQLQMSEKALESQIIKMRGNISFIFENLKIKHTFEFHCSELIALLDESGCLNPELLQSACDFYFEGYTEDGQLLFINVNQVDRFHKKILVVRESSWRTNCCPFQGFSETTSIIQKHSKSVAPGRLSLICLDGKDDNSVCKELPVLHASHVNDELKQHGNWNRRRHWYPLFEKAEDSAYVLIQKFGENASEKVYIYSGKLHKVLSTEKAIDDKKSVYSCYKKCYLTIVQDFHRNNLEDAAPFQDQIIGRAQSSLPFFSQDMIEMYKEYVLNDETEQVLEIGDPEWLRKHLYSADSKH